MRRFLLLLVLAFIATPGLAGNAACTSQMVTGGFCPDTTHRLLFYAVPNADPDGAGPKVGLAQELADAICSPHLGNYQATLADGTPNPESCVQFADKWMKQFIRESLIKRYRDALKEAEKQAAIAADPVPELP